MSRPRRLFGYGTLLFLLEAITDKVRLAKEQEERGEKVTAIGISKEDIADLCEDYLPSLFNPYMISGDVKREARISESTLRRAIRDGELKGVGSAGEHIHFFKKWDVREFIKKRLSKNSN